MRIPSADLARISGASAAVGAIGCLALLPVPLFGGVLNPIAHLLLLAILVYVPLALPLVATPDRAGRHPFAYRLATWLQPGAAALAVASFLAPTGGIGAALALPWLLVTVLLALFGLWRWLPRGFVRVEESCLDAGLLYLPVGGFWLLISRAGLDLGGFGPTIVLLTAVHFHFAGFLAPVLAGTTGRAPAASAAPARRIFRLVAIGVIAGPPLVGLGIAFSGILEVVGVVILAGSYVTLAGLLLTVVAPRTPDRRAGLLLGTSGAAVAAAMVLALAYALTDAAGHPILSTPQMVALHGALNAGGFVLCGLLGWRRLRPATLLPAPHVPVSALRGRGRIGPDFFGEGPPVPGLVDNLASYGRADLDPAVLHPAVRSFYEDTARYALAVRPEWRRGFRLPGRLYAALSVRLGQLNLPVAGWREDALVSRFLRLPHATDAWGEVRGWVRTYRDGGQALYVAAYASHRLGQETYMNIAFPLPWSNLTSVLRLEHLDEQPGALLLSTRQPVGDAGVYLAVVGFPVRLPLNETIRVWAVGDALQSDAMAARHDIWLCGVRFLTLHYAIEPRTAATSGRPLSA